MKNETKLDLEVSKHFAFAEEKLQELNELSQLYSKKVTENKNIENEEE